MHHPTDRITHTTAFVTPVVEHWLEREISCNTNDWLVSGILLPVLSGVDPAFLMRGVPRQKGHHIIMKAN